MCSGWFPRRRFAIRFMGSRLVRKQWVPERRWTKMLLQSRPQLIGRPRSQESRSELSETKMRGPGFCTPVMEAGCPWRWGVPLDGAILFAKSHFQRATERSWGQEGLCWERWHTSRDETGVRGARGTLRNGYNDKS